MLIALLGLAIAEDEATASAHDHQNHAGGAGIDEHDEAGEATCFLEDRIGRLQLGRAGGGGRRDCQEE